ncbi:uncharacterized protein ACHE_30517S [Aspergillus chevalieri]|uniref:Uncharacterized protein n=1 Tax=Aspergillus chevalieri TaxID=182096 RepID=A0A7R7VKU6_ASPCH|nr:uncharacterized protein ACHE_30517S [Aspergillus chevalieri]BCR86530.1 hypothetical protein ACHE_30517S [Aspergillus chevalieri]
MFLKYQSALKALDIQALFWDMEPDYECRELEQNMAHHRDPNVPRHLNAAGLAEFEQDDEIRALNEKIAELGKRIGGQFETHKDLVLERNQLYSRKAKRLRKKRAEFVKQWWDTAYDEYVAGNDFTERDLTCLFDIYRKYMPERSRIQEALFKEVPLDSEEGKQCLRDMISLCTSTEKVAYYPRINPIDGHCLV